MVEKQETEQTMTRSLQTMVIGISLAVAGMAAAYRHHDGESVRIIKAHDIKEKLDGKDAKVTVVEFDSG